jgi:hypothetical protein
MAVSPEPTQQRPVAESPPLEAALATPLMAANDADAGAGVQDVLALGLVSAAAAACACFWSSDGDLGFHLATGREILATGRIPGTNVLSFGEPSHAWALHQWLPAVMFELLHRAWGIAAVIALKMAVVAATWAVVYRSARVAGASVASSTLTCLLGVAASAFRFEARPYLFTHLTLALILWACAAYSRAHRVGIVATPNGPSKGKEASRGGAHRASSASIPQDTHRGGKRAAGTEATLHAPSVEDAHHGGVPHAAPGTERRAHSANELAAANGNPWAGWRACAAAGSTVAIGCQLHAGALDSMLALLLFALGISVEQLRARASSPGGGRAAAAPALAAVSGAVIGAGALALYHPLGARVLLFPFEMGSDAYLAEHLVEFRNPWAFPWTTLSAYWLLLGLFAALGTARARVIHAAWLVLGLVFALLSLRFVRMAFAFSLVVTPALALALEQTRLRVRPALLAALALALPLNTYREHTPGFGYEPVVWPQQHFAFIRTHNLEGNVFTSDAWAGPFLGTFYPERRSFFDNRLEAYSPSFMRDVYQHIRYAKPGWDQLLDRYAIEILLLRYTSERERQLQSGAPNLRQHLASDPRYTLLRFDDVGELFVRTQGLNAPLAEQLQLRGIDPDRRRFTADPAAAAPALLQALQRGERSATLLGMAAQALSARGDHAAAQQLTQDALHIAPDDRWVQALASQLRAAR